MFSPSSSTREKPPKFGSDESWLEDEETPFFLNSSCNSFPSLDLKKLSSIFGIDVTAYSFRRIVTTWALSHKSEEIRAAEEAIDVVKVKLEIPDYSPRNLMSTGLT